MKLTKTYLKKIINEELEDTLDEARLGVQRAARDIAERFGGDFDRQVGGVSVGGGRKMSTIKYFAVFDETEQRNEAWDILLDEGEDIGQMGATRHPIILWNGVKLYRLPFHGPGYIGAGIGVASKGKVDNIPESRGYTDAPGAKSYRSHPKSYQSWEDERPDIADEQDAWRAGGSDLYERGQEDARAGRKPTIAREDDNSHGHYAMGYRDGRKK